MPERSIELVTGPYRSGKSTRLLERVALYCAQNPLAARQAIITVPSHRYKKLVEERLVDLVLSPRLKQDEAAGLVGLRILPFYDLCHQVLRQAGCAFRLIPDSIRPAILVKSIEKVRAVGKLTGLDSIADFAGTHAYMLELIDELERAGLSPSEVLSKLSKVAASDARYMELGRVYEAYWQELENLNVFDERKLAYKTREVLNNLGENALSLGFFAVDGFDRFNRLQIQVLHGLARQAEHTVINFDYIEEGEAASAPDAPANHSNNLADSLAGSLWQNYAWKTKSVNQIREAFAGELIEKTASAQGLQASKSKAEIINFRALDRMMEMEEIAREVKKALIDGFEPAEIIVVARSVKPYMPAIRAAFERAQVDYFLDEPIQLESLPLIKFLQRLIKLPHTDFARQEMVRTLSSPFLNREYLGLSQTEIQEIDEQSLSSLTVRGAGDWLWALKLSKLIERLSLATGGQVEQSLTEHVAFIEDLIDDLLILPNDDEFSDQMVRWEEHQALFEFRRVLANLVLEETLLAHAYGPQILTYQAFLKRLDSAVENANFRRPRVSAAAVTVCSADLVPNRRFKVMIMAGLNEGEFPRRSEQGGFLSRDEVRKWMTYGIDIDNPRHHQSFEPSLFDSLIERATERLCQSSPMYEMNAEELIPSFFLTRGDEALAKQLTFRAPREHALLEPTSAQEYAAAWLWQRGRRALSEIDKLPAEARQFLAGFTQPLATVVARTDTRGVQSELNGFLKEQIALGLISVKTPEMWSVSRLNAYGNCPFKFWVSYLLKIDKVEEPEHGLDVRLLGEVYHKTLEFFYLDLKAKSLSILSDDAVVATLFDKSIVRAIDWLESTKQFRRTDFWNYEKKEITFRLKRFFSKEKERALKTGEFIPTYFEKGFGAEEDDSAPPLLLQIGAHTIKMRGRVDRIDLAADGRVRVIDYKSGSAAISPKEALEGRNMQLPVYAMAVSNAILPGSANNIKFGQFLSFTSGDQTGIIDFHDSETDYVEVTKNFIGEYVSGIKSGDFSIRPSKPDSCRTCDHSQVCRIAELNSSVDDRERD